VFSESGIERFLEDMQKLSDFFVEGFWGGSAEDVAERPDMASPVTGGAA